MLQNDHTILGVFFTWNVPGDIGQHMEKCTLGIKCACVTAKKCINLYILNSGMGE